MALSIKQKILFTIIGFVLLTALLIGGFSQWTAKQTIEQSLLETELPLSMKNISGEIDKEIRVMSATAEFIATDPHLLEWQRAGSNSPKDEAKLIQKLNNIAQSHGLSKTSFANRQTGDYWNQEGFLRRLVNNDEDGWFYAFTKSGKSRLVSIYLYPGTNNYDLFVNYQQLDGLGLAGMAKSFEDAVKLLNAFQLGDTGFVYLADKDGVIQLHKDKQLIGKHISEIYGSAANSLTIQSDFNLTEVDNQQTSLIVSSSYIPSAEWFVVAQVPREEVFSKLNETALNILIWTLAVAVGAAFIAVFIANSITQPIATLSKLFTRMGQGEADLSYRIPESGQQELVAVAKGYNAFIGKLAELFETIALSSRELRSTADELALKSQHTQTSAASNDTNTQHISNALSQINTTVSEIAQSAVQASDLADNVRKNGSEITNVIVDTKSDIEQLGGKINDVSNVIATLTENTETIAQALGVIEAISDQTNLLALNAAIEAARAGEHGRGFAVVAEEVRSLAGKTADSTTEIQTIMEQLQQTSTAATSEIEAILAQSASTKASISQAQEKLELSTELTLQITDTNHLVATATEQQAISLNDINNNMSDIRTISEENMANVQAIASSTEQLNKLAETLDALVKQLVKQFEQ